MDTILVFRTVSDDALDKLKKAFSKVHYFPDPKPDQVSDEILKETDAIFINWSGLPDDIVPSFSKTPRLKLIQMPSAGSERAVKAKAFKQQVQEGTQGEHEVKLCNASGIHVTSIPQWCICQAISLLHQTQKMIVYAHEKKKWGKQDMKGPFGEEGYYSRDVTGKTVGFLGYGTLGRETARLFKPFLVDIIAANSSGKASKDTGYIMPGTGDIDGTIPSEYYATTDDESFNEFLKRTDILVCSLPSTSKTKYLLTKERLALLPKGALFLNVGRGDLVRSEDLLEALDNNLSGCGLDVTDPEPLTQDHPLYTHPDVIVTPHISGNAEREGERAIDLLLENAQRFRDGKELFNVVDIEKGY